MIYQVRPVLKAVVARPMSKLPNRVSWQYYSKQGELLGHILLGDFVVRGKLHRIRCEYAKRRHARPELSQARSERPHGSLRH